MLETIISSATGESFTLANALIVILASIFLGLVISFVYIKTNKKNGYNSGFSITLVMLPVIISIIIRFRSAPGDPKDISYIFFTLAVGLACGMGYIGYAVIFTIILCALMFILDLAKFASSKG